MQGSTRRASWSTGIGRVVTCPAGKQSISWLPNTHPAAASTLLPGAFEGRKVLSNQPLLAQFSLDAIGADVANGHPLLVWRKVNPSARSVSESTPRA